jgi:ABC-2 type transport system ATP-binding protein
MSENIINIKNLSRTFKVYKKDNSGFGASIRSLFIRKYEEVVAVNSIDLTISKGEIRGLIGPNGAGKSTTLKILSGVLYPSGGEVSVMGFQPWLQREKYVKRIGVVFGQKSQLVWELPALDTFSMNKVMYEIPNETYNRNIKYFNEILEIEDVVKKPVRQLSLGERMKCEFVAAMLHEPPLIFLDEPTIGLDIISKETLRNFIKKVNKERNTTFILTTHDINDIEDLCHNVSIINKGTIVYNDTLEKIQTYYSKKKIIKVKFLHTVLPELLEGFNVIQSDRLSAEIEINLEEMDIKEAIYLIFEKLPVQDIDIANIQIEEVIKEIYTM